MADRLDLLILPDPTIAALAQQIVPEQATDDPLEACFLRFLIESVRMAGHNLLQIYRWPDGIVALVTFPRGEPGPNPTFLAETYRKARDGAALVQETGDVQA
ncbi:MAG: hypothetical protein ACOZDY_13335 [Pseudomonadota bacterium]